MKSAWALILFIMNGSSSLTFPRNYEKQNLNGVLKYSNNPQRVERVTPGASYGTLFAVSPRGGAVDNAEIGGSTSMFKILSGGYFTAFLFGYHLGVVNAPLPFIAKTLGFADSTTAMGSVVSTLLAGAFAGSVLGGGLADRFGIRNALLADALVLGAGTLVCAGAPGMSTLLVGRLLCGLGIGVGGALVPVFIGQVAANDPRRGMMGTLNQVSICTGILASIVAGFPISGAATSATAAASGASALSPLSSSWNFLSSDTVWWRAMFALGVIPALLQAASLVAWAPRLPPAASVSNSSSSSSSSSHGWSILLDKRFRRAAATGALLFVLQQFSGVNAVVFFSTQVFAEAGVKSAVAASVLVALTNIAGTLAASQVIDKVGRKPLLSGSFLGMGLTMLAMAACPASELVQVGGTVAYIAAFALGVGPIPALLLGEAIPRSSTVEAEAEAAGARSKAASVAMAAHWACNFAVGGWFLAMSRDFGVSTIYRGFGTVALAAAVFVALVVPETKGT